jgi:hypothetical protein
MKKQILNHLAIIVLLTAASATAVLAQSVKVDIKFDFRIGKKVYPAGEYILRQPSRTNDNVLQIGSAAEGKSKDQLIITTVSNAGKIQAPKLVFERYADEYFLTKIFLADSKWGFSIKPEAARKQNLASTKTIEVAAEKQ